MAVQEVLSLQNLLERRLGRTPASLVMAVLFGLSHFNKRAAHFNWRYVVMAALAHALVDTTWSLWLR